MTKQEIKDLCEDDQQLEWWAMVLFAEIAEYHQSLNYQSNHKPTPQDHKILWDYVDCKMREFPKLIIQRQLEKAKAKRESSKDYNSEVSKSDGEIGGGK